MLTKRAKRFSMPAGDKRREPREELAEGAVRISGQTWPLTDWSRNGFLASPCTADLKVGEELDIAVFVPIAGQRLEFKCPAVIIRVDEEKQEVAGAYVEVDAATRATIDWHFGVDSERIRNILDGAESAEQGVAMLSTIFPNLGTGEVLRLAQDVCREQFAKAQQTLAGLEAIETVMGRAPEDLDTQQELQYLAERGDLDAAGLLFRLRGGLERRLSDQLKKSIDQAVRQGREDIAEQLLLSHEMILKQDSANRKERRKDDSQTTAPH